MPRITYVDVAGKSQTVEVQDGTSIMEGAVQNGVEGIIGECGGSCACATCHVYVDDAWRELSGRPNAGEAAMLEFVISPQPGSRLGCQIKMSAALDGIVVNTPADQG